MATQFSVHALTGRAIGLALADSSASPVLLESVRPTQQSWVTANDSDVTFTIGSTVEWKVLSIYVALVTTATVGNRQLEIRYMDSSANIIFVVSAGATQAASLTRQYSAGIAMPAGTTFVNGNISMPLPDGLVLPAGYQVRVFDAAAIDAAADDMVIRMMVDERTTGARAVA